jgi:hypothetical protein
MKLYARQPDDSKEKPWRRPLLICPEPEFSQIAEPRKFQRELEDSGNARLLPTHRIEVPAVEERLVIELLPGNGNTQATRIRADGRELSGDLKTFIDQTAAAFKNRMPHDQADEPSATILIAAGASRADLDKIITALRAAHIRRLAVKSEL